MHDVFLSYSRHDSEHALALADRLRSSDVGVWMDQSSLQPATSWSSEIVEAVDQCRVLILLLSRSSVESDNVVRELTIAFEARKAILPVRLERVDLPTQFRYPLAGIQRAEISDFDGILAALNNFGIGAPAPESTTQRAMAHHRFQPHFERDNRKSLIILPFDDLSPSNDNQWFADGLSGELIDALARIKSLRVLDRKTSLDLRGVKQSTTELGRMFNTRYFIEGSVRKFGNEIKISVSLLDVDTGDHLWQDAHRGEFKDVFDIQESVAEKVVQAFKLHLTKEEQEQLSAHETQNPDAYEFQNRAMEYFTLQTKEGLEHAIELSEKSILSDPNYATAYQSKAIALSVYNRNFKGDPRQLEEAETLIKKAIALRPNHLAYYYTLSTIYVQQRRIEDAEAASRLIIERHPDAYLGHFALGVVYWVSGQKEKSIEPYENAVRIMPDNVANAWNLLIALDYLNLSEKREYWAKRCAPFFLRYEQLHPDDELARVSGTVVLLWSGDREGALERTRQLTDLRDPIQLMNAAGLLQQLDQMPEALQTYRKAFSAGCRRLDHIKDFLSSEEIAHLRNTEDYIETVRLIQEIEPTWRLN